MLVHMCVCLHLCCAQMALVENWSGTMYDTMNTVGVEQQPLRDANQFLGLLYVLFMIIGSLSIINLIIGVSINKVRKGRPTS